MWFPIRSSHNFWQSNDRFRVHKRKFGSQKIYYVGMCGHFLSLEGNESRRMFGKRWDPQMAFRNLGRVLRDMVRENKRSVATCVWSQAGWLRHIYTDRMCNLMYVFDVFAQWSYSDRINMKPRSLKLTTWGSFQKFANLCQGVSEIWGSVYECFP
jgi:hypothetical protein